MMPAPRALCRCLHSWTQAATVWTRYLCEVHSPLNPLLLPPTARAGRVRRGRSFVPVNVPAQQRPLLKRAMERRQLWLEGLRCGVEMLRAGVQQRRKWRVR